MNQPFNIASSNGLRIGSFNLKNLKSQSLSGDPDPEYRVARLVAIAEIIKKNNFAVVALQEVKDKRTVEDLCARINGGPLGQYQGVHCATFYDELFSKGGQGFRNKTNGGAQAKGELAFIWKESAVTLATDDAARVVYERIDTRIALAVSAFMKTTVDLLIGFAAKAVAGMRSDKGKDKNQEPTTTEDAKRRKRRDLAKKVGIAGLSVAGMASFSKGWDSVVDFLDRRKAESFLQSTIRPPFVVLFKMKDVDGRQLRLINVHSQFGLTRADQGDQKDDESDSAFAKRVRHEEAKFIAQKIFPIVDSERSGNCETAYTMALGDFNVPYVDFVSGGVLPQGLQVAQKTKSSLSIADMGTMPARQPTARVVCIPKHDYDHFLFRMDVWDANSAFALSPPGDDFFVKRKRPKDGVEILYPVSDHCPVCIISSKL